MPRIIVLTAFAAMLTFAAHGQTNPARAAGSDGAPAAPEPPTRDYFEQLQRDQAEADARRRAAEAARRDADAKRWAALQRESQGTEAPAVPGAQSVPGAIPGNTVMPSGGETNRPIRFTHPAGRFSVVMPRLPKCSTDNSAPPPITQAHLRIDQMEYQAAFRDFPPEDVATLDQKFQEWLDWALEKVHARLEHRALRTVVGHTAWEFEVVIPDGRHWVGWYFFVGKRLYQVNILGPGLNVDHPTTRAFIDSFQLLESSSN